MHAIARVFLSLALASAVSATASDQSAPLFRFTEAPGPHKVGLKVVEEYDYSRAFRGATDSLGRPYTGERARPMQTLIWYPAEPSTGKPMTVRDYANLLATETSFGKPPMPLSAKEWIAWMRPTLGNALWAVRDAPIETGRFPVVIYAPSFSSMSWENADLCELLAHPETKGRAKSAFARAPSSNTVEPQS